MKRLLLLAICSGLLHAEGFDGWGKLKWGATKGEALDAYRAESAASTEDGVSVPNYKVGDDSFAVMLTFDADGFSSATLIPSVGDCTCRSMNRRESEFMLRIRDIGKRIQRLLDDKYGPPSKLSGDPVFNPQAEWLLPGGNITFYLRPLPAYRMRLIYERKPKALDRL